MSDDRTQEQVHDTCEKACSILSATNDGNDLDPMHLALVESAVNGFLTEKGKAAFEDLVAQVKAGYKKPWLHGIEHLTISSEGYVSWKGKHVEHFNLGWHHSDAGKEAAEETARRCRIIEARGEVPNNSNVVWTWNEPEEVKVGS